MMQKLTNQKKKLPFFSVTLSVCRICMRARCPRRALGGTASVVHSHRPIGKQMTPGLAVWLWLGLNAPVVTASSLAQISEEVGVDEPGIGVVLHQAVNFPLRCQEAGGRGLLEALDDGVFGLEVQVNLG